MEDVLDRFGQLASDGSVRFVQHAVSQRRDIGSVVGVPRWIQDAIQNHAERIHVRLFGVAFAEKQLRRGSEGSSGRDLGDGFVRIPEGEVELLGRAEVADFEEEILGDENVGKLQISMQNVVPVQILDGKNDLNENKENGAFREETGISGRRFR